MNIHEEAQIVRFKNAENVEMHSRRRRRRTTGNLILKVVTSIAISLAIVSACLIDSASIIPIVVWGISMTWIILFCHANDWFFGGDKR